MKYDPIEQARLIYEAQPTAYNASAYQLAVQLAALRTELEQNLKAAKEDRANAKSEMLFYTSMADKYRWQPIETAPKDGDEILTYGKDDEGEEYFWVSGWWPFPTHEKGSWTCWHNSDWATHWMPLPERPEEPTDA